VAGGGPFARRRPHCSFVLPVRPARHYNEDDQGGGQGDFRWHPAAGRSGPSSARRSTSASAPPPPRRGDRWPRGSMTWPSRPRPVRQPRRPRPPPRSTATTTEGRLGTLVPGHSVDLVERRGGALRRRRQRGKPVVAVLPGPPLLGHEYL